MPVFPGMVTDSGDLVVLAVQRKGEDLGPAEIELAVGDTLLLQGTWDALDENLADPEVLVVNSPDLVRRQAVPLGTGAKTALAILAGMVVALATGVVPAAVAGLVAACLMVLLRVLSTEGAYRAISWTTVVLVAGMMPAVHRDDRRPAPPTSSPRSSSASWARRVPTRYSPGCSS